MKALRIGLVLVFFLVLFGAAPARALIVTTPYVAKPASPLMITGYSFSGPRVNYVQIFNPTDAPIDLSGWRIKYDIDGETTPVEISRLDGLLRPSNYIVAGESGAVPTADFSYTLDIEPTVVKNAASIRLISPSYEDETVTLKTDVKGDSWQRNISTSTGNYLSTFTAFTPDATFKLFAGGLYEIPPSAPLQITEILANPHDCSPLDTNLNCSDYVKFYNPSTQAVDLSQFRLRLGYENQSATSSNTYALSGEIPPGHFVTITKSADDRPLSVTNSGGFVWLEDIYGLKKYGNTVQDYADASLDSKKGQAWAYDASDGTWKWTIQPTPGDEPSVFPFVPPKVAAISSVKSLTPCREDQYRSEETNRCRSIATATSTLTPCAPNQERSSETNRCRKIATAASTRVPCKENQERNPDTNRCRNKTGSIPGSDFAVTPVKETGKTFAGWWALGGLGVLAIGYGVWEWHYEIISAIRKTGAFLIGRK